MKAAEKPTDGIAQALDRRNQHSKRLEAAHAALKPIASAIEKCTAKIREREVAKAALADVTAKHKATLADEALGEGDPAKLKAMRAELAAAKQRVAEAEEVAAAAEQALDELQRRHAVANAPITAMAKDMPGLDLEVLRAALMELRKPYLAKVDDALDDYAVMLALLARYNTIAKVHGLPRAFPDGATDARVDFPGIVLPNDADGTWQLANQGWIGPERMKAAEKRLDERLRELGV